MLLCERMTRKSVQRYNKFLTYASFWAFFLLNRIKFYVLWAEVGSVNSFSPIKEHNKERNKNLTKKQAKALR